MSWRFNNVQPLHYNAAQLAEYLGYPSLQAFEQDLKEGLIPPPDGGLIPTPGVGDVRYWHATKAKEIKEARDNAIKQAWGYKTEGGEDGS